MNIGNSNSIEFPDEYCDCVLSRSQLERHRYFWRTTAEIRRVLKKDGPLLASVPIYMTLPTPTDKSYPTKTYARRGLACSPTTIVSANRRCAKCFSFRGV